MKSKILNVIPVVILCRVYLAKDPPMYIKDHAPRRLLDSQNL